MFKLSKSELQQRIYMLGLNASFAYNNGDEEASWRWLFLREKYKDFLKNAG